MNHGKNNIHEAVESKTIGSILEWSNINKPDSYGQTALHYAAAHDDIQTYTILLNNGADVHIKDMFGFTPIDASRKDIKRAFGYKKRVTFHPFAQYYSLPQHRCHYNRSGLETVFETKTDIFFRMCKSMHNQM